MAGVKELRLRIKSVGNIKQITRAMEMVSTTKLRRFQDRAVASRPYAEEITALVANLARVLGDQVDQLPLFREGAGTKTALLLVSSDRGLCGAYNSNLFVQLEELLKADEQPEIDYFVYGRKGYQYLTKHGRHIERFFVDPNLENIDYGGAAHTAQALSEVFLSGEYAKVEILYTAFESMVRYIPTRLQLLPITAEALGGKEEDDTAGGDVILEPDAATIFDAVVPRYVETRVYNALLEALTSEFASRRVSMKNATDAATDMQGELKQKYNRLRQENITKELLDIVGGVEALSK
ncbi:MAG TPA: ATP synthase F1 subunit gamma [Planctomycetaceae bacterium]|nr:ATP synthase F1 subunit gamma [Planctomycetaceae bacterium]